MNVNHRLSGIRHVWIPTYPAPATYNDNFPIEMGIPFTPKSPSPRIRDPKGIPFEAISGGKMNIGNQTEPTIGNDGNPRFVLARPVPEDLANLSLVLQ